MLAETFNVEFAFLSLHNRIKWSKAVKMTCGLSWSLKILLNKSERRKQVILWRVEPK